MGPQTDRMAFQGGPFHLQIKVGYFENRHDDVGRQPRGKFPEDLIPARLRYLPVAQQVGDLVYRDPAKHLRVLQCFFLMLGRQLRAQQVGDMVFGDPRHQALLAESRLAAALRQREQQLDDFWRRHLLQDRGALERVLLNGFRQVRVLQLQQRNQVVTGNLLHQFVAAEEVAFALWREMRTTEERDHIGGRKSTGGRRVPEDGFAAIFRETRIRKHLREPVARYPAHQRRVVARRLPAVRSQPRVLQQGDQLLRRQPRGPLLALQDVELAGPGKPLAQQQSRERLRGQFVRQRFVVQHLPLAGLREFLAQQQVRERLRGQFVRQCFAVQDMSLALVIDAVIAQHGEQVIGGDIGREAVQDLLLRVRRHHLQPQQRQQLRGAHTPEKGRLLQGVPPASLWDIGLAQDGERLPATEFAGV